MISIIITAWEDPKSTSMCISLFLKEKVNEGIEILAACPDEETKDAILDFRERYPGIVHYHKQEREMPKNDLMNDLMKKTKGRIIIFTDGNKFIQKGAVSHIIRSFKDERVGCVGGRIVPLNKRDNIFGYWAHLLTNAANVTRLERFRSENGRKYIEFSANLLAIKNNVIKDIPTDVAEDAVIPYMFFSRNYRLVYNDKAIVRVLYPTNMKDWIKQKTRSIKSHESLNKYIKNRNLRIKTFLNEIIHGSFIAISYPRNVREFLWTLLLFPARLYVWILSFYQIIVKKEQYEGSWSRSKSTLPLD